MIRFSRRQPAQANRGQRCGFCDAKSAGTVHGWPLCTLHLTEMRRRELDRR